MTARRKLVRTDNGRTYLERWGVEHWRIGGVFLHRITAPDPGQDMHDHPWWFVSLILTGSYVEARGTMRTDLQRWQKRERWSLKPLRTDELHKIVHVNGPAWTLVVHGPKVRNWGYKDLAGRWIAHERYHEQSRRGLTEVDL
jgi:hypothetical protein